MANLQHANANFVSQEEFSKEVEGDKKDNRKQKTPK